MTDLDAVEAANAAQAALSGPDELLSWWTGLRGRDGPAIRDREDRDRVMWITGPMSVVSFATARLMETWAHGQDVADGVGVELDAHRRACGTSPTSGCARAGSRSAIAACPSPNPSHASS